MLLFQPFYAPGASPANALQGGPVHCPVRAGFSDEDSREGLTAHNLENQMKYPLFACCVAVLGLVCGGTAEGAPAKGGRPGHGHGTHRTTGHGKGYHHTNGVRTSRGWHYRGSHHNHWSHRVWSARFGRYHYYDAGLQRYFYYDAQQDGYYVVEDGQ
jgi:hypothetical protein